MHLLLALLAAVAFALGAMVYKRAFLEGAGLAHLAVVNNVILALVGLPLLVLEPQPIPWPQWPLPVLTGAAFVAGHCLNLLSLRTGDVSLATPLLGSKVIFVAAAGWLVFDRQLEAAAWVATALATAGVVAMGLTDVRGGRRAGFTTVTALGCAAAFALTDVMIEAWGGPFGVWGFLGLMLAAVGLLSLGLLPVFGRHALRAPATAWGWVLAGAGLSAVQALLVTVAIAVWRDAAGVNVVYATRGLWSIGLIWFAGGWLKNRERETAGGGALLVRLLGAALILAAVGLTAWEAGG